MGWKIKYTLTSYIYLTNFFANINLSPFKYRLRVEMQTWRSAFLLIDTFIMHSEYMCTLYFNKSIAPPSKEGFFTLYVLLAWILNAFLIFQKIHHTNEWRRNIINYKKRWEIKTTHNEQNNDTLLCILSHFNIIVYFITSTLYINYGTFFSWFDLDNNFINT